jgi:hypothetical protein
MEEHGARGIHDGILATRIGDLPIKGGQSDAGVVMTGLVSWSANDSNGLGSPCRIYVSFYREADTCTSIPSL